MFESVYLLLALVLCDH